MSNRYAKELKLSLNDFGYFHKALWLFHAGYTERSVKMFSMQMFLSVKVKLRVLEMPQVQFVLRRTSHLGAEVINSQHFELLLAKKRRAKQTLGQKQKWLLLPTHEKK